MSWNYRLCKTAYRAGTPDEEIELTIREVYYREDGSICSYSENAIAPRAETPSEMKWVLEKMQEALNKDLVDLDELFR
jgi:hypothetical protein